MSRNLVESIVAHAMVLATDGFDNEGTIAELRDLAGNHNQALEQAIKTCLAQPASLATRHRAIELLARARYEDAPPPGRSGTGAGAVAVGQNRSAGERRR
jgi:hypothetical protein